jgi:hypothetical protein
VEQPNAQCRPTLEEAAQELSHAGNDQFETTIELLHSTYFSEEYGSPLALAGALYAVQSGTSSPT